MQLKRDTDYVLRILHCIAGQTKQGASVSELSRCTAVPVTIASRLCNKMSDAGILDAAELTGSVKRYALNQSALNKTLYDIICIVENHSELFAVFDRSTALFKAKGSYFDEIEDEVRNILMKRELKDFKKKSSSF